MQRKSISNPRKPNDYVWNLAYHLAQEGRQAKNRLETHLCNFAPMQAKLKARGIDAVLEDYDYAPQLAEPRQVQDTLRQSAHILALDPDQPAGTADHVQVR